MPTPIADAFVRLRPDVSGFAAEAAASITTTLERVTATGATVSIGRQAAALEGVAAAGLSAAASENAYNAALAAGGVVLGEATVANNALAASQARVARSSGASAFQNSFAGLRAAADESNFLRGSLIGLSRITPVAVFGLGVIGTAAIAAGLALRASIKDAAQFEQTLNVLQAVTQSTGEQMDAVAEKSQALGRDIRLPGVSATDAAVAMTELAKAGLTVEQSMAAAEGVLQLATAATISAGDAAKITASALNAFALSGDQATHVADLLAASSIAAQGEITDMAAALQQVSAVAANANISVDDTVAAITLLAQSGLLGSDAGTSLRTTILRLVPTTKEAAQFQKALGVETTTTTGEIKNLADVSEEYRQALMNLSEVQQQQALQQIFGQDAIRAATIFAREGAEGFNEARDAVERQGAAADIAAAKSKGLSGAWSGLTSNAETLATNIGLVVIPALTEFVTTISQAIGLVNDLVDALKALSEVDIPDINFPDLPDVPGFDFPGIDLPDPGDIGPLKEVASILNKLGPNIPTDPQSLVLRLNPITAPLETIKSRFDAVNEAGDLFGDVLNRIKGDAEDLAPALDDAARRASGLGGLTPGIPLTAPEAFLPKPPPVAPTVREILKASNTLQRTITGQLDLLDRLGATAFEQEGEAARNELERQIDGLLQMGFIAGKQLANIAQRAVPFLGESLRREIQQEIVPNLFIEPVISDAIQEDILRLAKLPGGTQELQQIGVGIQKAIADGVDQGDDLVKAAERAVDDAIDHMNEAIADAVKSAGSNLDSLATDLAGQIGEVLDHMDFGVPALQRQTVRIELQTNVRQATQALRDARERGLSGAELDPFIANVSDAERTLTHFATTGRASVETLQDALDGLEDRLQRRQLQFSVRSAERELRDAREEIANISTVGFATPSQRQAVTELLDPLVEGVAQAKGDLRSFDLSTQIKSLEDITEKAKKAAEDGIEKLVEDFKEGRLTAGQFEQQLNTKLAPVLDRVKKDFGQNLGFKFTKDFLDTFDALVNQARLLTGFIGILGAQPGRDVVDPNKTVREQQRQVADARRNLEESLKNQAKTAQNSTAQVKLLGLILAAIQDTTPATLTPKEIQRGVAQAERLTGLDIS